MKIKKVTLKNVKSFKEEVAIDFNDDFNILVGPNGGGKSNLLDVITIVLRNFFINTYIIEENSDAQGRYKTLRTLKPFDMNRALDKFRGDDSDSQINIELEVSQKDIENIETIKDNLESFEKAHAKYRNSLGDFLERFRDKNHTKLESGQIFVFNITNNNISLASDEPLQLYYHYLNYLHACILLSKEIDGLVLNNIYLYFSPYRRLSSKCCF